MKPHLEQLNIAKTTKGLYKGVNSRVAVPSNLILLALVLWAVIFPEQANKALTGFNDLILTNFARWYIWLLALFTLFCFIAAAWPKSGKLKLGQAGDTPEFSNFSWISMMFGAGIGVGMMTWSIAEPLYHLQSSPEVIMGTAGAGQIDNVNHAFKWAYLHWGLSAWATYAVCGLAMGYFAYRRNLPLTIRSTLSEIFGRKLEGWLGHTIDIVAVVATILGIAQTLGFGVEQFVAGMHRLGLGDWLLNEASTPSSAAIIFAVLIIVGASTVSAISGVGKGIKWLSNLNMVLSMFLLSVFLIFGASWFGVKIFAFSTLEYILELPKMMFTVWKADGTKVGDGLASWQGAWTVFTFAWWIAFAPFVGLFLARISKGRTIREFLCGAILAPTIISIAWFAFAGGTAAYFETSGLAGGSIFGASDGAKMFATMDIILSSAGAFISWLMALIIVILLMTYLVTSADSAILIINTINSGGAGKTQNARYHIIFWGITLGLVVGVLQLIGGLSAIKTAMVIGALPFSLVMVFMCASTAKAIYRDTRASAPSELQKPGELHKPDEI